MLLMLFSSRGSSRTVNPGTSICTGVGVETVTSGFSTRAAFSARDVRTPIVANSKTTRERIFMRSRVVDDHGLYLREQVESIRPFLAAPAALLEPTPWRRIVEGVIAIHPNRSGLQRGGGLMCLAQIARPNARRETERR